LKFAGEIPVRRGVFNNGNWYGALNLSDETSAGSTVDFSTMVLPYVIRPRDRVLVLGARTGSLVAHAVERGARSVVGIEDHGTLVSLLQSELAAGMDSLAHRPGVTLHAGGSRTYLLAGGPEFDLIILPLQGSVGGSAGLYALREEYVLTVEAMQGMWNRLSDTGAVCISAWMDYPYRAPLRAAATIKEMLLREGITSPGEHLVAVRSWGTISYVLSRTRLDSAGISRIRQFCEEMGFDPTLLPTLAEGEQDRFNKLQDSTFFSHVNQIVSGDPQELYETYPFRIDPCTDNHPFFSQYLKWSSLSGLKSIIGPQGIPFLEIGYLLAIVTLLQTALFSCILIVLPLLRKRKMGSGVRWTILYFGALGIGYLFIEMVLIQRFVLPLGDTILSATVVMGSLLVSSGAALLVAFPPIMRIAGSVLFIAPLGFVMGMPFPLGLRVVSRVRSFQVAWAWGINGCMSVVSTSLAVVVAVEVGLVGVFFAASGAYLLAFLGSLVDFPVRRSGSPSAVNSIMNNTS
jgi:hypothetical protein